MGASNDDWGHVADDPGASTRWDEFAAMPHLPTDNAALKAFAKLRGLELADLTRTGARYFDHADGPGLCWFFPDGYRKYRIATGGDHDRRWTDAGATWTQLKVIRAHEESEGLIVVEGETDGALMTRVCPTWDIGILPSGARSWHTIMAGQCDAYEKVLVGLDADEAGDEGAATIMAAVVHSERLRPPDGAKDWCEAFVKGFLPAGWSPQPDQRPRAVFTIREVLDADLGTMRENHWLADAVCPVGGLVMLHGPVKSMKSVLLMELLRALTTGDTFAGYIPYINESPHARALLFQMEISPYSFRQRMTGMLYSMGQSEEDAFVSNMLVYGVANRQLPRFKLTDPAGFRTSIIRAVHEADADVVAFDPVQRLAGAVSLDKPNELAPLFSLFEELQDMGKTVIFTHHDSKAERNAASSYSAAGSQRFAADPDAICSVYHDKRCMIDDNNTSKRKQRNFVWEVRDGMPAGRSLTVTPSHHDPEHMDVEYGELLTPAEAPTRSAPSSGGQPPID